jgi:SAM-dependent methyltransferase
VTVRFERPDLTELAQPHRLTMLTEEAKWLNRHLSKLPASELYPMCNIGSSTKHYRLVEQPYIDKYLFEPARLKNRQVIHVDVKPAEGVDLVGDLADPNYISELSKLSVRSVMCCNLLEHVTDRTTICKAISSIVRPGGYLIATVPYKFPYHEDPIDTLYRPTVGELVELFPKMSVYKAATIRASRFGHDMHSDYRSLGRMLVRAGVPFYRPRRWWNTIRNLGEIVTGYKVTCAILRKETMI